MDIRVSSTAIEATPKAIDPGSPRIDFPASGSKPLQQIAVQPPSSADAADRLNEALQSINDTMRALSQNVEFSVDDSADHRTIVRVVDQQTKEIIRQMPSEEALQIAKGLDRMQGLLIHQKA
ncbi:MAG TPA: flagellar protein FlaG [Herminiimonas sp.]|nr:flagellar protein FlaG [Herminiimonas sp.]